MCVCVCVHAQALKNAADCDDEEKPWFFIRHKLSSELEACILRHMANKVHVHTHTHTHTHTPTTSQIIT